MVSESLVRGQVKYRLRYADRLKERGVEEVPYPDVAIQRAGDQLKWIVRIEDRRSDGVRVLRAPSTGREAARRRYERRHDLPGRGHLGLR